jgi:hypothetical protein
VLSFVRGVSRASCVGLFAAVLPPKRPRGVIRYGASEKPATVVSMSTLARRVLLSCSVFGRRAWPACSRRRRLRRSTLLRSTHVLTPFAAKHAAQISPKRVGFPNPLENLSPRPIWLAVAWFRLLRGRISWRVRAAVGRRLDPRGGGRCEVSWGQRYEKGLPPDSEARPFIQYTTRRLALPT